MTKCRDCNADIQAFLYVTSETEDFPRSHLECLHCQTCYAPKLLCLAIWRLHVVGLVSAVALSTRSTPSTDHTLTIRTRIGRYSCCDNECIVLPTPSFIDWVCAESLPCILCEVGVLKTLLPQTVPLFITPLALAVVLRTHE